MSTNNKRKTINIYYDTELDVMYCLNDEDSVDELAYQVKKYKSLNEWVEESYGVERIKEAEDYEDEYCDWVYGEGIDEYLEQPHILYYGFDNNY